MNILSIILALLPIMIILALLIFRRSAADITGIVGWVITFLIAWQFFKTPAAILLKASLSGIIASLPITLMVMTSIFQVTVMSETGAIARVVALIKTISPRNKIVQIMIINVGFGTLLAAMGATPVSILPPIMVGLGYSTFTAIALPALGYDALCTYALLGIPVVVFSGFVKLPVQEVSGLFARFMPVISTCIALGMLWIVGRWRMMLRGIVPAIVSGVTAGLIAMAMDAAHMVTLTGIASGLGVIVVMLVYLGITRQPLFDRSLLAEQAPGKTSLSLPAAFSPWIILVVLAILVNATFLPFYNLTFTRLAMPVEIVPGEPEKVRLLWQAYFWILISTLLALPFLKIDRNKFSTSIHKWSKRAPRPMLASAVFFAIAFIINHSGKGLDWMLVNPDLNMVHILANASAAAFGKFYPLVAPFLGLLGGFISGSETSAIAMLTQIHLSTAQKVGAFGLIIAAASGIGGGLASVISPAKLQNAAASIDRIGEEGRVLRVTFVISIAITIVCAVMAFFWAY